MIQQRAGNHINNYIVYRYFGKSELLGLFLQLFAELNNIACVKGGVQRKLRALSKGLIMFAIIFLIL